MDANIDSLLGTQMTIQKKEDNKFGGLHPNGINNGHEFTGKVICDLKVGLRLHLQAGMRDIRTSEVISIGPKEFKTKNSTYEYFVHP